MIRRTRVEGRGHVDSGPWAEDDPRRVDEKKVRISDLRAKQTVNSGRFPSSYPADDVGEIVRAGECGTLTFEDVEITEAVEQVGASNSAEAMSDPEIRPGQFPRRSNRAVRDNPAKAALGREKNEQHRQNKWY
jgi:hypothetical protein